MHGVILPQRSGCLHVCNADSVVLGCHIPCQFVDGPQPKVLKQPLQRELSSVLMPQFPQCSARPFLRLSMDTCARTCAQKVARRLPILGMPLGVHARMRAHVRERVRTCERACERACKRA